MQPLNLSRHFSSFLPPPNPQEIVEGMSEELHDALVTTLAAALDNREFHCTVDGFLSKAAALNVEVTKAQAMAFLRVRAPWAS